MSRRIIQETYRNVYWENRRKHSMHIAIHTNTLLDSKMFIFQNKINVNLIAGVDIYKCADRDARSKVIFERKNTETSKIIHFRADGSLGYWSK